jgi:arylsulfatase A-like enzyme
MGFRALRWVPALAALCLPVTPAAGTDQPTPVILISIDTLRADHLGAYGYTRIQTPNIDSFAEHGTIFTAIDSQIPLTLPSHASLFTSAYPFEDQIEENAERVSPGAVTLASVLRRQGYKTGAFLGCVFLERQMGIDQGFDLYDSPFDFEALSPLSGSMFFGGTSQNPYAVRDRRDGALVTRPAIQWLAEHRNQPVFAFVHLFDLHKPYKLEDDARRRGISGYDAEIEYVDRLLGAFKKALVEQGWWDRALVILLADHGEGLGEHGESAHGYFVYESTIRVPLILHWPSGSVSYPPRTSQPAGLIDVAPAILDFLHVPAPPSFRGRSLLGPLGSGGDTGAVYSESLHTYDSFGWAPLRSLRVGPYKYIDAPRPELYNLQTDPHEQANLAGKDPARAQALRTQLMQLLSRYAPRHPAPPSPASPQTRALQSLGYLSGGPRTVLRGPRPDPKDRLPEFHQYESAQADLASGRRAQAIATLRQLLAGDPGNTLARRDLGSAYLDQGDYARARTSLQLVLAAAPDDYVAHFELGLADENLKLFPEALDQLETACRIAPDAPQCRSALDALKKKMK